MVWRGVLEEPIFYDLQLGSRSRVSAWWLFFFMVAGTFNQKDFYDWELDKAASVLQEMQIVKIEKEK